MAQGVADVLDSVLAPLQLSVAKLKAKERYAEDVF
jgi:sulfite reductase (NADPH) flavoprotein alpha-component